MSTLLNICLFENSKIINGGFLNNFQNDCAILQILNFRLQHKFFSFSGNIAKSKLKNKLIIVLKVAPFFSSLGKKIVYGEKPL